MDLDNLLDQLKFRYGDPVQFERQHAFRWDFDQLNGGPHAAGIHLCLTMEVQTRKASIWIFDPRATGAERARYLHIRNEREMNEALEIVFESVPAIANANEVSASR